MTRRHGRPRRSRRHVAARRRSGAASRHPHAARARCGGRRTATLIVAATEGAVAMCRARRTTLPLEQSAEVLESLVEGVLGDR
ncbi:LmrA/YxaF family transcription factor [Nocardia asteroides]